MPRLRFSITCLLLLLPPMAAYASEPVGVWIVPDRVQLLPNAEQPQTIQLSGLVLLHTGTGPLSDWGYPGFEKPQRGSLFYSCPAGKTAQCTMEWRELANALGQCVGFGNLTDSPGKLRAAISGSDVPDVYPLGIGVVHGFTPCQVLARAQDAGAEDAGPTPVTATAGRAASTTPSAGATAGTAEPARPSGSSGGATATPPPASSAATSAPGSSSSSAAKPPASPSAGGAAPTHVQSGCNASALPARPEPMIALLWCALVAFSVRRQSRRWR